MLEKFLSILVNLTLNVFGQREETWVDARFGLPGPAHHRAEQHVLREFQIGDRVIVQFKVFDQAFVMKSFEVLVQ